MAWKINLKRDETLEINGARIRLGFGEAVEINGARVIFTSPRSLLLLDQALVVLPSGRVVEPRTEAQVDRAT